MPANPLNSVKGFGVTFKQIFKKPITQQYPEYKRPVYPRFRGRHRLHLHENGLEKCVGCSLCAAACPADCIRVVAEENTPENRVSPGERYARIYEINMSRCIFCGYCELACPFDAITLGNEFELSEYSRDDLIYTKDMLLAEPIKQVPVADPELFDTPIPYYKTQLVIVASFANVLVWAVWVVAAFACLGTGIAVISFTNPFYSSLSLIGNLASLAVMYLLLSAEFVAAAQVLVYAGAVMVMFLFVTAYLGQPGRCALGGRAELADAGRGRGLGGAVRRGGRGRRPEDERPALAPGEDRLLLRAAVRDRPPVPDRPAARLRDHLDRAADRGGRRRDPRLALTGHADAGGPAVKGPDVVWYLCVAGFLFCTGALGVLIRRSPLIVLLSLEIMLNGANLALIAFSRHYARVTARSSR